MIPVNPPLLDGNEAKYLQECISSGYIGDGPFIERFEHEFKTYLGRKHAIAVSSGTAALDIAVEALEIGEGDEVIMPTLTIISCVNQILRKGAIPVFVDCDPATWNMENDISDKVAVKLNRNTAAIMMVHLYGLPVDADPILEYASLCDIPIIEDASQMLGQTYKGRKCGTLGTISTFSFHATKIVTCGEGGMIVTDDDELAAQCRTLRYLAHSPERRFRHNRLGWNYRMTNMQAAIGCAQLEKIDEHLERKALMGYLYNMHLAGLPVQVPIADMGYAQNIYWAYPIVTDESAEKVMKELAECGIDSRPFFWPLHLQPFMLVSGQRFPHAERAAYHGLYLPSGLAITDREIRQVCDAIGDILGPRTNKWPSLAYRRPGKLLCE